MTVARGSIAFALLLTMTTAARAQTPPPSPPPSPAQPPPAPPTPEAHDAWSAPPPPMAFGPPHDVHHHRLTVDVETTRPDAVLERRAMVKESDGSLLVLPWHNVEATWEQVCVAPCRGLGLDPYATYRVVGTNGVAGSRAFTLPQGEDPLHLRIDAGNLHVHRLGGALVGLGTASLIVGAALLTAAPGVDDPVHEHNVRVGGWVTGGAGLVLLAVGIPLFVMTSTRVYADNDRRVGEVTGPRFTGNGFVF